MIVNPQSYPSTVLLHVRFLLFIDDLFDDSSTGMTGVQQVVLCGSDCRGERANVRRKRNMNGENEQEQLIPDDIFNTHDTHEPCHFKLQHQTLNSAKYSNDIEG